MLLKLLLCMFTIVGANAAYHRDIAQYAHSLTKLTPEGIDLSTARPKWRIHWVQSKRHRLWFSTKTCSCYSTKTTPEGIDLSTARPKWRIHWVQSKRHRLWFSTKTCSCYSTKTHINSVILILKLNLTSLRNKYIKMCVVLNEVKFNLRMRIMLFTWVFV